MNIFRIFNSKFFITILVLIFVTAIFVVVKVYSFSNNKNSVLSFSQKRAMVEYAKDALSKKLVDDTIPNDFKNFEKRYNRIFVTFLENGQIRCCQGGYYNNSEKTVKEDLDYAIKNCVKDSRFDNATAQDAKNFDVVIDVLYNEQNVISRELGGIKNEIEIGLHAIKVSQGNKKAYFKASVPVESNYSLQKTLERLCQKADLKTSCYKDSKTNIAKFDSISFGKSQSKEVVDFYRGNVLIDTDDIQKNSIFESIRIGYNWMENNFNETSGLLMYKYYPSSDSYSKDNNYVRGMAAIWMAAKTSNFLQQEDSKKITSKGLNYYLSFAVEKGGAKYIKIDSAKLSYNAFAVLALIEEENYLNRDNLIKELSQGILNAQRSDGSFSTDFENDSYKSTDYYPGEAMLALMQAYYETGEEKYALAVEKAFPYYKNYWYKNKNTAFIPWQSQAYFLLYQKTKNIDLANFVFEMNDWLVDNYQNDKNFQFKDYVGGFKSVPGASTSAYLEGLADAYNLAVIAKNKDHIKKYKEACKIAARFVMQTQFTDNNMLYIENKNLGKGGFRASLVDNAIRVDNAQHALSALMKIYQSNIFD